MTLKFRQDFSLLPDAGKFDFVPTSPRTLSELYPSAAPQLLDVVEGVLRLSASRRVKANIALSGTWFDGTLVPSIAGAWYGVEPRVDLSSRCVEGRDGARLCVLLEPEMREARGQWA